MIGRISTKETDKLILFVHTNGIPVLNLPLFSLFMRSDGLVGCYCLILTAGRRDFLMSLAINLIVAIKTFVAVLFLLLYLLNFSMAAESILLKPVCAINTCDNIIVVFLE